MGKDPAFLFYPGEYLKDTQCLSEKAQVAYDRIMCEHMRDICEDMNNIALTKQQVNFFTKRLSDGEKEELLFILTKIGNKYQIYWVAESIAKRKVYSNSRASNRKGSNGKHMSTHVAHMEDRNENKDVNKKEEKKKEDKVTFGEMKNVKLTKEQYQKLLALFSEKTINDYIQKLSLYISSKGKKYKCHYSTVLSWLRKDGVQEISVKENNVTVQVLPFSNYKCDKCQGMIVDKWECINDVPNKRISDSYCEKCKKIFTYNTDHAKARVDMNLDKIGKQKNLMR